ncbi:hypothetical protein IGI96_001752 [Enterococcus sp. DIV0421]|uniref:ASCH/PUA domain-containing protein n=1 Tax=Enterococcus sp. DIV0421 TaxID=2774688 RepID=UPI003F2973F6
MVHELKILPEFFEAVTSGRKQFEIRKNDRPFQVDDLVILREWVQGDYTGNSYHVFITYITDFGQPEGQVVFGFQPMGSSGN